MSNDEKSQTFRKRRLSLSNHNTDTDTDTDITANHGSSSPDSRLERPLSKQSNNNNGSEQQHTESPTTMEYDEKTLSFRKRRLSVTNLRNLEEGDTTSNTHSEHVSNKRTRRRRSSNSSSVASPGSTTKSNNSSAVFRTNTLHADEFLSKTNPPPSPATAYANNILYDARPVLPPLSLPAATSHYYPQPKWKKRLVHLDDTKLPFPKNIVGIYSCHGVEPVYEDDTDTDTGEYDNDNQEWEHAAAAAAGSRSVDNMGTAGNEWPVTAATEPQAEELSPQTRNETPLDETQRKMTAPPEPVTWKQPKAFIAAKINQDRGGIAYPYGNSNKTALFAVYDGHGLGGELVSQFALYEIQRRLEQHALFPTNLETAMRETFLSVDRDLKTEPLVEPLYAGTTACVVVVRDKTLTIANVGDSRAVLARANGGAFAHESIPLTQDQNPDVLTELHRITSAGGYVTARPAPGLSARVWLDAECTHIGLAMSRSIGDHAVSNIGVIADPVVTTYTLEASDDFLILATDGVWEFLESDDAVRIVGANMDRGSTKACQALIEAAAAKWYEEEGEYRDDITAIVVRVQELWRDEKPAQNEALQTK
jgi:protein phosphatase 2C family protein 2/3